MHGRGHLSLPRLLWAALLVSGLAVSVAEGQRAGAKAGTPVDRLIVGGRLLDGAGGD